MNGAPDASLYASLSAAGFRVLAPLPNQSLLVEQMLDDETATGADGLRALAPDGIRVSPWTVSQRISRELTAERLAALRTDTVPVLLHVATEDDAAAVRGWLESRQLPVQGSALAGNLVRVATALPREVAAELATELGDREEVLFVERVHRLGFFNGKSAGSIQSGQQGGSTSMTPIWEKGVRGEGQILGLLDSGVDIDGCQFRDTRQPKVNTYSTGGYGIEVDDSHRKIIAYDFLFSCAQYPDDSDCESPSRTSVWDDHGHGSHCAGSMIGDAAGTSDGMAPLAKLVVQDGGSGTDACSEMPGLGCPVIDLYPIFQQAYQQGVRVHNNSYGDNEETAVPGQSNYTARSQDVDRFAWDHKDMLFVFAAGNSGEDNADFSVGSPSTNKNGLSVGSVRTTVTSSSDENLSSFSSRGWTADGRIKPDILAPGCTSSAGNDRSIATNNCTLDTGCGTSYAAPILSGAAALTRQYFTDGFYPSGGKNQNDARIPSAALIKAMLLNSAVTITGVDNIGQNVSPIPSNEQGWGRVQLNRSLVFTGGSRKLFVDDPRTGFDAGTTEVVRYMFNAVSAAEPFKVTLVWTDFPGMPDAAPSAPSVDDPATFNPPVLVNDLDLIVRAGAESFLGNVFEAGRSRTGGLGDRRNNVEQVLLPTVIAGDVIVEVAATSIVQSGQDYALVVTGQWLSAMRTVNPPAPAPGGGAAPPVAGSPPPGAAGAPASMTPQPPPRGAGVIGGSSAGTFSIGTAGIGAPFAVPRPNRPVQPMAAAEEVPESGCGCRTAGARGTPRSPWLLAFGVLLAFGLRRRRLQRG